MIRVRLGSRQASWSPPAKRIAPRSEEHTSELQSQSNLVCRLLLEKKKQFNTADQRRTLISLVTTPTRINLNISHTSTHALSAHLILTGRPNMQVPIPLHLATQALC